MAVNQPGRRTIVFNSNNSETGCNLKELKRIAMRADKTDQSFAAMIGLAAAVIATR